MYYPPKRKAESAESVEPVEPEAPGPGASPGALESLPVLKPPAPDQQPRTRRVVRPVRRRNYRWLWLVAVVLVPVVLYAAEFIQCRAFTPTGDRLFDAYAREVVRRQAPRLFCWRPDGENDAMLSATVRLPDDVLAGLERNFGDDPRYWQLRYCLTEEVPADIAAGYDQTGLSPETYYLEVARDEGHADAATLYALWWAYYEQWLVEYQANLDDQDFQWYSADHFELDRTFLADRGPEVATLLDEMVAAEPGLSWPYYLRARCRYAMGEYAAALADLQAGNSAPDNRLPVPFPYSRAMDAAHDGRTLINPTFQAALIKASSLQGLPNLGAWLQFSRELPASGLGNEREWLAEFHRFSCRLGDMQHAAIYQRLGAGHQVRAQADEYLVHRAGKLSVDQRRALLRLDHHAGRVFIIMSQHYERTRSVDDNGLSDTDFLIASGQTGAGYSWLLRMSAPWFSSVYQDRDGMFRSMFTSMARFDYLEVAWPEEAAPAPEQR